MLARLLLFLLALAFVAPAATPGRHAREAGHHGAASSQHWSVPVEREDGVMAATACIGCVPPSNWAPGRIAASAPVAVVPVSGITQALTIGRAAPPALSPPRIG